MRRWLWRRICAARTGRSESSDTALLNRLERLVEGGERVEFDHGEGDGFLAGAYVGASLRAALTDLVDNSP